MESFNGHFKTENAFILWNQRDMTGVTKIVESRMYYYNEMRRHASLDNMAPEKFLKEIGVSRLFENVPL